MILVSQINKSQLEQLLKLFGLNVHWVNIDKAITGSFWGDPEAGLVGNQIYLRDDTPLQSALHEASHYVCMDNTRRAVLHTNSGGDYDEENAVCYLQILLAAKLENSSKEKMMKDMDTWGYSFRLGSAKKWFTEDADDAKYWLINNQIITESEEIRWQVRQ